MSHVKMNKEGRLVTVTIDRPPVNAATWGMYKEIAAVFKQISEDESVSCVILTASGNKCFMAGHDINDFLDLSQENVLERYAWVAECFSSIYKCPIPVIGAINGHALGTGFALAALCDFLYAVENATFGLPEINVGLLGGGKLICRMLPHNKARKMYLTGESIGAREMERYGAVEKVVKPEELMEEVKKAALVIMSKSPTVLRLARKALNDMEIIPSPEEAYRVEVEIVKKLADCKNRKEAALAFLEKRPPKFEF